MKTDDKQIARETPPADQRRAILVGMELEEDVSCSMDELEALAEAADVTVLGQMVQSRARPDRATLIGRGKVLELAEMCRALEADTVIFNDELSGIQLRNLEERVGARILDRTILILDIFAARAVSKEGKLQVELAQLQYRLPRLTGFGKFLSRTGAGIGTRGPGEKKLETDRRHISRRMDEIKKELKEAKTQRAVQRARREKNRIPVVALVGYTNAGKSAIMNRILQMTEKEEKTVLEKDMLFATLDTSQRNVRLESGQEFILIDTVGFVSRLPHSLIRAFRATLEEVTLADLLIHVTDISCEDYGFHIEVVNRVLGELGASNREKLLVYNKIDLVSEAETLWETDSGDTLGISAKRGDNMPLLLEKIREKLFSGHRRVRLLIPYERGDIVSRLCETTEAAILEHQEDGTLLEAVLDEAEYNRLAAYQQEAGITSEAGGKAEVKRES